MGKSWSLLGPLEELDKVTPFPLISSFFVLKDWPTLLSILLLKEPGSPLNFLRMVLQFLIFFFADDIVLFAEASLQQAEIIKRCLDDFCNCSGQRVNASKTRIFFSPNVNHNRCTQICDELGFSLTTDLGKYLGVPLIHGRSKRMNYDFFLKKAQQRLASWKSNSLNLAGRTTLVNSVITALPSYVMQTTHLPLSICDETEKVARNFLWGVNTNGRNKLHKVAWDKVCCAKDRGGLGIRHLHEGNKAFMLKNAWGLMTDNDSL